MYSESMKAFLKRVIAVFVCRPKMAQIKVLVMCGVVTPMPCTIPCKKIFWSSNRFCNESSRNFSH